MVAMPIQPYIDQMEPSADVVIWRYIDMDKFRDLVANEELYFRRADLFKEDDPHEGLPPDDYVRKIRGLRRFDLQDELTLKRPRLTPGRPVPHGGVRGGVHR